MGNVSTESAAGRRIDGLLDAGSFVEIGGAVKAREMCIRDRSSVRGFVPGHSIYKKQGEVVEKHE